MRGRGWFLLLAAVACSEPCDRLADTTCAREGDASRACQEIRKQATRAGEDDQAWCREALSILDKGLGAAPDAGVR
jgi:hypothetical protein